MPTLAAWFAADQAPLAPFFAIGHSHHQGIWCRQGLTVINSGSFPRRPIAVVLLEDHLKVWPIVKCHKTYPFEYRPLQTFELLAHAPLPGPYGLDSLSEFQTERRAG